MATIMRFVVPAAVFTLIAAIVAGIAFIGLCGLPELLGLPLSRACRMVIEPFV